MREPNFDDAFEDDLKTINFNKAIEALVPVVQSDYAFFESFLMDEYPDYLDNCSDNQLRVMHGWFKIGDDGEYGTEVFRKYHEYVLTEATRRAEG